MSVRSYLKPQEIELLEQAAINLRDRLLIRLLARLGCRISEVLALTVEDIDFEHGTVKIQRLKVRLNLSCPVCSARLGRNHAFCPKCGSKVEEAVAKAKEHRRLRSLYLDLDTLKMLRGYISRGGPVVKQGKRLLFGINRHRAWQIIRQCAKKANLPSLVISDSGKVHGVSPHRLRDSFAVRAIQEDDSTDACRMLQEWLGHENISTTMRYRKVDGHELKEWYSRLWNKKGGSNGRTTET